MKWNEEKKTGVRFWRAVLLEW